MKSIFNIDLGLLGYEVPWWVNPLLEGIVGKNPSYHQLPTEPSVFGDVETFRLSSHKGSVLITIFEGSMTIVDESTKKRLNIESQAKMEVEWD